MAFPIALMCRLLGVSKSGFYAWRDRPASERSVDDARLAVEIAAAHKRSRGRYGSPRVHAELRARGIRVGRKRVERLMREQGLRARGRRRFRMTTDSEHSTRSRRTWSSGDFEVAAPNEVWVTDVTYVWTLEGWLYLAVDPRPLLASGRGLGGQRRTTTPSSRSLRSDGDDVAEAGPGASFITPIAAAPTRAPTTVALSPRTASSRA